jgi:hypothetical protein
MIDISSETVVTLTEAAHRLPPRRGGKRPNVATLFRWTTEGVRPKNGDPDAPRIKLEWGMVGSTRCTSLEALQRFIDVLTAAAAEHSAAVTPPQLTKSRQKAIEAAKRRLARAGV